MAPNDVRGYREGVLLASAGAILHNLGKISSLFVQGQCGLLGGRSYFYQHVPGLLLEFLRSKGQTPGSFDSQLGALGGSRDLTGYVLTAETKKVLRTTFDVGKPFNDRRYCIGDLIEYLGQGEKLYPKGNKGKEKCPIEQLFGTTSLLTHLMNRCHHGASGGEKDAIYRLQQVLPLYLATPLGYERPAPDLEEYDGIKDQVEKTIQRFLSDPGGFSLGRFLAELEPCLRRIPAETRRGVNDVTVWDIGHSGMAFLKAGIWSCAAREKEKLDHHILADWKKGPRWRLWRVGLNGLDFLTGAVSVADLRVRQRELERYLDRVQAFVEDEYPVATEVYRDENGAIYVFPDWDEDPSDGDEDSKDYKAFKDNLEEALAETDETAPSLPRLYGLRPATELLGTGCHNHPECSQEAIPYIGDKVLEWIKQPPAALPVLESFPDQVQADLCPYCGVRPVERAPQAGDRKICRECLAARGRVSEDWWNNTPFSTIWVDEVTDANGRVALVIGKFGVERLLGELVYPNSNKPPVNVVRSASFARFRRVWETTAQFWNEVAPLKRGEDCQGWEKDLAGSIAVDVLGIEGERHRLEFELEPENPARIMVYQAYELESGGISVGIVPITFRNGKFTCVTIENMGYIAGLLGAPKKICTDPCAASAYVQQKLFAKTHESGHCKARIKQAQGYGTWKSDLGRASVASVRLAERRYMPVIPILAAPRIFAVLLPASAAVKLVRNIHREYAKQMGKVRWRLPLTLGTVFFPRHLPLRIVLDAGWRLLEQAGDSSETRAKVDKVDRSSTAIKRLSYDPWPEQVTVTARVDSASPDGHELRARLSWKVPTVMGDRYTIDFWYPWVKASIAGGTRELSFSYEGRTWVHVNELQPGDEISFYPSTWDFVFLDGAAQRFALAYHKNGRRLGLLRRPYYLEEIDDLINLWEGLRGRLTTTQLHSLWRVLLEHHIRWDVPRSGPTGDKTWWRFCRDTLLNAEWRKDTPRDELLALVGGIDGDATPPRTGTLTAAAVSGVLFDLFELHLSILKEGEEE